jgi:hypothetical protein
MGRSVTGLAILVALAAVDFAALDDITTGVEPGFTAELTALALSILVAWFVVRWLRRGPRLPPPGR